MDSYVFRRVINQMEENPAGTLHTINPSHNQLDVDFLSKISNNLDDLDELDNTIENDNSKSFLSTFPCYENFKYETGLTSVLHCGNGLKDEAEDLIKTKIQWAKKLRTIQPKKERDTLRELEKMKKSLKKKDAVDLKINNQEFLDHFLNEPEPSFKGAYNWLYTGGCISNIQHEGCIYLCCPDTLSNSPVIKLFKSNEDCTVINEEQIFYFKINEPVLQVCLKKTEEDIIIGVRQKTRFTILSGLSGKGNVVRKWKKSLAVDRILTSFDINSTCEEVVVTDADMTARYIKIYSIETNQKRYKYKNNVRTAIDSWNQVLFRDRDVLLSDRTHFCIIDSRASKQFCLQYSPLVGNELDCEVICNMMKSKCDPNFIYLGTTHTLMQLDIRYPKPVQRWTHLMKHSPQYGDVVLDSNGELILLQGLNVDDFIGIKNERIQENDDSDLLSKSTPCLLKGMNNSLRIAQYNGLCLNPLISRRFGSTITGSCVVKDKNDLPHYFITNALGDVYGSQIKRKDDDKLDDLDSMLDSMKNYEAHFRDLNVGETVHINSVKDLGHIFEKVEELGWTKDPEIKIKNPHAHWKYREMYAPESLAMYKDFLAKKVAAVWGISNSDDEENEEDRRDEDDEVSVSNKVEGWLQQLQ